ncbi:MAG: deoxyribonuclease IV [Dehalococcoidia bacterium]|nr:deoxyribonuclease IV [Dehalococcoidia bacterium]
MRIGAHISAAGGIQRVFGRAKEIGAEAVQVFPSAPQQWKAPVISDDSAAEFKRVLAESGMPAFFHGVYLINFGSKDEVLLQRSVDSLATYLDWAGKLGVTGTIFHVGSHLGSGWDEAMVKHVCTHIRRTLDAAPNDSLLILENNAGQGNCIGGQWEELGAIIRGLDNDPRLAVCFDTCHALAMNHDIRTDAACEATMDAFDREIGLDRLAAVHANDSKQPLGGLRDRHENIGDGYIGLDGFAAIMRHPAFRDVPFLLEVPGLDGKGPDRENIMRLKAIRAGIGIAPPVAAEPPHG